MDIPTQLKILFLTTLANWISKEKSHMIEYLLVANRILKSKLESDGRRRQTSFLSRIDFLKCPILDPLELQYFLAMQKNS